MEKQVLKKEEKVFVNGFIISVQLPTVPPRQTFVETSSDLAETVAKVLDSTPHAIILVQALDISSRSVWVISSELKNNKQCQCGR
jgi:hypothetical protein